MVDEVTTPESPASAPTGSSQYTDEQLSAAFPNQDIAHVRAMMDKRAGKGEPASPNADGPGGTPDAQADTGTQTPSVEYPDFIPEKFRQGTVDDAMRKMAESYSVLERARGAAEGGADGGADGDGDTGAADDGADAPVLNLADIEARWVAQGQQLTEADYAEAEAAGMPRAVLDGYMAGQQALATQLVTRVHTMAGGEQAYSEMLKWAESNWAQKAVDQFDSAVTSGDVDRIELAVKALKADYVSANGKAPSLVKGESDGVSDAAGFQSKAEMTAAMKDPRYKKDPAYRAEVARRIHAGNVWGNK